VSSFGHLGFAAPRSEAARELAGLIDAEAELDAKLDRLDREQRAAAETVARLSAALVELERRELAGGKVTAAQRSKAEAELAEARAADAAPWGERRTALRAAIGDHHNRVQAFIAAHFVELLAELEEDGAEASRKVNDAAATLVEAAHERDTCSKRVDALVTAVRGQSKFGDVVISRGEAVLREAERMLSEGGEVAPTLRPELVPREGVTADEPQPEPASV
jgi:chromosome segregation ATPase